MTAAAQAIGLAALYLAAYVGAAMLFFLLDTDYPSGTDPAATVCRLLQNQLGIRGARDLPAAQAPRRC